LRFLAEKSRPALTPGGFNPANETLSLINIFQRIRRHDQQRRRKGRIYQ
jgi:hypothetical protein